MKRIYHFYEKVFKSKTIRGSGPATSTVITTTTDLIPSIPVCDADATASAQVTGSTARNLGVSASVLEIGDLPLTAHDDLPVSTSISALAINDLTPTIHEVEREVSASASSLAVDSVAHPEENSLSSPNAITLANLRYTKSEQNPSGQHSRSGFFANAQNIPITGTLADREEPDHRPIHDSVEDRYHPPSTFGEGSCRSDSIHRVPYDSRRLSFSSDGEGPRRSLHPEVHEDSRRPDSIHRVPHDSRRPSFSSDGEGPRWSPHPEVHRVRDDSPVARPPSVSVPTPTQPTTAERPASIHDPREATVTPFDLGTADDDRGRLEALNDVAAARITVQNAEERREVEFLTQEDRREDEFRRHEGDRQHYFEECEERRNAESRQRSDGIWQELETRLKALPAPTRLPRSPSRPVSAADADNISSIRDLAQQAASQHASDVTEAIRLEREDAPREREALAAERAQLMAEISAQKDAIISEKDVQITTLEAELARVRAELEEERQQRGMENSEIRERDRQEFIERDENIKAQLGDITNLVQDQRDVCEEKRALMDARWEQKEARREEKDAHMIELREIVLKIHDDLERDRSKCEDERRESQEGFQRIIEELRAENFQQRELLTNLSESWRADCERHHKETLETVRPTANEQVSFNVQGYLDDFARALVTEVRVLLGEVGRIREERRALQHEIGELLCMKSKYGPGGEFEPDWTPPGPPPQLPTDPPILPIPEPTDPPIVRSALRSYHPRKKEEKESKAPVPAASVQQPQAEPSHMGSSPMDRLLGQQVALQSIWRPGRKIVMTPLLVEPTLRDSGLFEPTTPTSSIYDESGPQHR